MRQASKPTEATVLTPSVQGCPFDMLRAPIQRATTALVAFALRRTWRSGGVTARPADLACSRQDAYALGRAIEEHDDRTIVYWKDSDESCCMLVAYRAGVFTVSDAEATA